MQGMCFRREELVMNRTVIFALALLCAINAHASMLIINHYMEDSFPFTEAYGGVTNTTLASIQTNGVLGSESYSAEVSYGSAKASAQTSSGAEDYGLANANLVAWEDTLTITAAGYNFSGFIDLTFSLSGALAATSGEGASSSATYEVHINYDMAPFYSRLGSDLGGDPLTDFTADGKGFDFGQAFDLRVELGVYTGSAGDFDSGASASATDIELTLTGIKISETEGGDAIAATIISDSGTSYPVIPEPTSIALIGLASAGFLACRRFMLI
jgi:hypothetical protein